MVELIGQSIKPIGWLVEPKGWPIGLRGQLVEPRGRLVEENFQSGRNLSTPQLVRDWSNWCWLVKLMLPNGHFQYFSPSNG